jgi:hypothetical protein
MHDEEFPNLYSSPNIIRMIKSRRMKSTGHVARIREKSNACKIFVGKPEGKRTLGRHRHSWEDNIKTDITDVKLDYMYWIDLARDRC